MSHGILQVALFFWSAERRQVECLHICGTENLVARVCDPVRVPRKSRDRGAAGKEDQIQRPEASVTELFIYQRLYIVDIHVYIYIYCIYIYILYT